MDSFLSVFNGKCMFLEKVPTTDIQTDACPTAAGAFFHGDWLYHSFVLDIPEVRNLHINFKEVFAIILGAKRWSKLWCNKHVIIQSDNTTAVSIINPILPPGGGQNTPPSCFSSTILKRLKVSS